MPGYLDSASAELLHPAARATLLAALDQGFADPLALHKPGRDARLLLDNAREVVASCLSARPDEVTFTASGTAAVHAGVLGLLAGRSRVSTRLVHSAVEHSAVLQAGRWFSRHFSGTTDTVPVDAEGRVSCDGVGEALRAPTGVLAVQSANSEVGTVQPIASVVELAGDVPLFLDFAASAGRLDVPTGCGAQPPRRTPGVVRQGSAYSRCARAPGGVHRSPPTTGPTRAPRGSRTFPPFWHRPLLFRP